VLLLIKLIGKQWSLSLVKGLYFCGEVIDIDAHIGEFNLQIAFSTGCLAVSSIERWGKKYQETN
jgi:predicted flavoprotein YhiN